MIARYLALPALLLVLVAGCDTPTNTGANTPAPAATPPPVATPPPGAKAPQLVTPATNTKQLELPQ